MTAKVIDGRKIAKNILQNVAKDIKYIKSNYQIKPNITTIIIGSNPESDLYLRLRDKACNEVGIISSHLNLAEDVSEQKVIDSINELNIDEKVHGIFVQFPLPKHLAIDKIINTIDPSKDVEGFTSHNMGCILLGEEYIIPCTPLAVLKILQNEKYNVKGKDIVIVNHSYIVGKPLTALLLNRNASVSVCHVFTKNLRQYTSNAEVLITGAGVPKLITVDLVKKDAFVIDVGIVKKEDRVCGDVDFESVKDIASKITPVPGGVGPVTVACSLENMTKTINNCID